MQNKSSNNHIKKVSNFQEFLSTSFQGEVNAICLERTLKGDFSEIVEKIKLNGNLVELDEKELNEINLSKEGNIAREIILKDLKLLKNSGAAPVLNVIKCYERDDALPYFSTDVYSFHVDKAPIPTQTILCTYYGDASEIIPNIQAIQKIHIPEIRDELLKIHAGSSESFESFLTENFFDLHYEAKPEAQIVNLGKGNIWKLAVDHPRSNVLPCIHRAPSETNGQKRLLLIC